MSWPRNFALLAGILLLAYLFALLNEAPFRGNTLQVLGQEVSPAWQRAQKPETWFANLVDPCGYVSYDGETTIECSSRIEFNGDHYVADFSDLQIGNGNRFDVPLVSSATRNLFGSPNRRFVISLCGQIDQYGQMEVNTRFNGYSGDTVYEFYPESNRVFRVLVIERTVTGARSTEFRFRIKLDGTVERV